MEIHRSPKGGDKVTQYIELENPKGTIYIRKDKLAEIAKVDTIVFDCDGVLLDVRNAYNVAIAEATRIIIEAFTGTVIPVEIFDSMLNFAFKRTGGFNNDWSHAYAVIMRILAEVPEPKLVELNKLAEESLRYDSPKDRFDYMSGKVKTIIPIDGLYEKLMEFASQLDASGIEKVDKLLLPKVGSSIKKALKFRGEVGESIVSTLFEELFLGKRLFTETFGFEPCFVSRDMGIVEADEVVILGETLDELESILGGSRFGVASGSLENTARHALREIKDRFPQDSQYWHDVVDRDAKRLGEKNLHKPNPYPLLKASEKYNSEAVLYVGDTMADYLTAENAGEGYVFAGVYGCIHCSEDAKKSFLDLGSDVVAPTVNEIPVVLRYARGETQ
ncbi:HAD family hydrolase [Candidatus Bathyarchaeota archaeon]|nr:MAG: HAD family hydrolase [Candidatus Bathyarchaeota archaeon]